MSGIRITHPESGAVVECCEEREQWQNKKRAFRKLAEHPKFIEWQKIRAAYALQGIEDYERAMEEEVMKQMAPKNLKIEYYEPEEK